jgi:hypothetical protein
MKVSARDVHRTLRQHLGPALELLGFRAIRGASFAAGRSEGERYCTLWAQSDKYGWDDDWGGSFTIEFQLSLSQPPAEASILERARISHLLAAEQLDEMRLRNNAVIEQLPGFLAKRMVSVSEPDGTEIVVVGVVPADGPYIAGHDIWFHYSCTEHLQQWSAFVAGLLPTCLSSLHARES